MSWVIMHKNNVLMNPETGEMAIQCGCGEKPIVVSEVKPPLVVDALEDETIASYLTDPTVGDKVLEAIMTGRQILINTPNVGGTDLEMYSPVVFYQMPENGGRYVYLFYLRDGFERIEAPPLFLNLPIKDQIKLILSKEYYETPLSVK